MKKALWKDTFREIRHSLGRFLAILFIILIGVAFYVGIRSAGPDMLYTANRYYEHQNLMDAHVLSSIGLDTEDIEFLNKEVNGTVQHQITKDVIFSDSKKTVRLYGLENSVSPINKYWVTSGRLPEAPDEIALDDAEQFATAFKIGDTITIDPSFVNDSLNDDEQTNDIYLNRQEFRVVGFIRSPLFIEEPTRGNSLIGGGNLNAFAAVLPEVFDTKRHTDAYITFKNTDHLDAYSSEYKNASQKEIDALKDVLEKRAKEKQIKISGEIEQEIADGETKLQEAKDQLQEGRKKIADAEKELNNSRLELDQAKNELATQRMNGRQRLDEAWKQWQDGKNEFLSSQQKLQDGQAQIEQGKKELANKNGQLNQLQEALNDLNAGRQQLEQAQAQLNIKKQELAAAMNQRPQLIELLEKMEQLGVEELQGFKKVEIEQKLAEMDAAQAQIDAAQKQLDEQNKQLEQAAQKLDGWNQQKLQDAFNELSLATEALSEKESELERGWNELHANEVKITNAEAELNRQETHFQEQIAQAEAEIALGEEKWSAGLAELNEQKAVFDEKAKDAEAEIASGEKDLIEARKLLADLPKVQYFVNDRNDNPGYSEFEDNAARINAIADVLPIFFFFVAILISLTTMTRMVDEEREYIGIMKAMGYRRLEISIKFITYAFIATTIGAIAGLIIGYPVFPLVIYDSYGSLYNLPDIVLRTYPIYTMTALGASYLSTVVATVFSIGHSLRQSAAELLRPKAPKEGQRILLEKITPLWERFSFKQKITLRNLFRYKTRMLMTIFGIAGSCGLILTGFGISDSIVDIPSLQFEELSAYQVVTPIKEDASVEDISDFKQFLAENSAFDDALSISSESVTVEKPGINTQEVTIYAVNDADRINEFIKMKNNQTNEVYSLEKDDVYITTKLAELLGVQAGDTITVKSNNQEKWNFKITGIVENYLGHFLYMTPETFEKETNLPADTTLALIKYNTKTYSEQEIGEKLLEQNAVLGVSHLNEAKRAFTDTITSLDIVTNVLVISAALLAFTVLYNLTNINVTERIRELSTIKVLGFYDREVTAYIYRENIILTLMGILAGYVFGYLLHGFVIRTTEIDMMRFSHHISWSSYAISAALTLLFSSIVMIIVHYKLKNINMADALKGGD